MSMEYIEFYLEKRKHLPTMDALKELDSNREHIEHLWALALLLEDGCADSIPQFHNITNWLKMLNPDSIQIGVHDMALNGILVEEHAQKGLRSLFRAWMLPNGRLCMKALWVSHIAEHGEPYYIRSIPNDVFFMHRIGGKDFLGMADPVFIANTFDIHTF